MSEMFEKLWKDKLNAEPYLPGLATLEVREYCWQQKDQVETKVDQKYFFTK